MPILSYSIILYIIYITSNNNTLNTILASSLVFLFNYLSIGNIQLMLLLKPLM